MRRRGGIGFFGFLIIMYTLSWFFDMVDTMPILLFGFLLPMGVFGAMGYGLYKLFSFLFSRNTPQNNRRQNVNRGSQVKRDDPTSYVKNSKNAQIDRVLSEYFKKNVSLVLFDEVSISVQGANYTTVDNLYISYADEKICQLKEFKTYYPEAYDKVIEGLAELAKKPKKQEVKKEEKKEKIESFSDADKFIDQINSLNRDLYNEEVTNGLYQTCDLLKQIDIIDKEDGTIDPKLNKLYEYYLPILTGILENYKRLSNSSIKGEEFKKCETQLVKTIKLINEALKTIYNSLHESDYMNLNADINTLQSLLKQDGLVDMPFKEDR